VKDKTEDERPGKQVLSSALLGMLKMTSPYCVG
jgi:hypothetical protein